MTMVPRLRCSIRSFAAGRVRVGRKLALVGLACLALNAPAVAQSPSMHYQFQGLEPPGAIGSWRLQRGGPLSGYFQPVEIKAPAGALISLARKENFAPTAATPLKVGMLIGQVYRLRVTNIPLHPGLEVFPTIEVIDRLYPPRGEELRFPIPIELTQYELELASEGKFVTRVVYLEEPDAALPVALQPTDQPWFDAGPGSNPLELADELGRPMVILRLGGRVPDAERGPDAAFLYGCPPYMTWNFEPKSRNQRKSDQEPLPGEPTVAAPPEKTAKFDQSAAEGVSVSALVEQDRGPSSLSIRSTTTKNTLRDDASADAPEPSSRSTATER